MHLKALSIAKKRDWSRVNWHPFDRESHLAIFNTNRIILYC